jgi:transposase
MPHPGPRAVEIILSEHEHAELWEWTHGLVEARLAERARVVLACGEGLTNAAVAPWCGVNVLTVAKWRARFAEHRLAGLLDAPRPGRPTTDLVLSKAERGELTRWARRATSSQALALRSKIVLACAGGADNKTVTTQVGCAAVPATPRSAIHKQTPPSRPHQHPVPEDRPRPDPRQAMPAAGSGDVNAVARADASPRPGPGAANDAGTHRPTDPHGGRTGDTWGHTNAPVARCPRDTAGPGTTGRYAEAR